jgi:D-xylonolactonase
MSEPILLCNEHCQTGENPYWSRDERAVYWTDIPAGLLFRYDLSTATHTCIYRGAPVGGFTMQADGSLLLFRVNDIAVLPRGGRERVLLKFDEPDAERFNDLVADPAGRVFAGTIGKEAGKGGLYRIDIDGTITKLFLGTHTANGMGFSPDLQTFYWTDTTALRIFRFDYDVKTGAISNRALFYEAPAGVGKPDGLTIDEEGNIWSARWNGGAILKIDPSGKLLEKIAFPVAKVPCCTFGGDELRTLFITTAGGSPGSQTLEGALFKIEVGVRGRPEFLSKILL